MSNPGPPDLPSASPAAAPPSAAAAVRPVALVTGAARRIGRAIALELADAGFDIALHHHGASADMLDDAKASAAELRRRGARVELLSAELSDTAAAAGLVPAAVQAFGRLDALVNNASRFEYDSPLDFDPALHESLARINVCAPLLLARALARQVGLQPPLDPGRGITPCVVNLLDQKLHNPNPDYFSYTLTKAALQHATVLLAQAFAPAVRVCGVSPGITLHSGPMTDAEFERARTLTPLGRSSQPQDLARAVRFLLESPAITGIDLTVDGGQHLLGQPRDVLFLARRNASADPTPTR